MRILITILLLFVRDILQYGVVSCFYSRICIYICMYRWTFRVYEARAVCYIAHEIKYGL